MYAQRVPVSVTIFYDYLCIKFNQAGLSAEPSGCFDDNLRSDCVVGPRITPAKRMHVNNSHSGCQVRASLKSCRKG